MKTVRDQIQNSSQTIDQNIQALTDQRGLLSQNILSQIRNLVEGIAVLLHTKSLDTEFSYPAIEPALVYIRSQAKFNFIGKFHKLIQTIASHYTLDGDASERLMLKYYEYLHRIRSLLQSQYRLAVLKNLESFPIDLDPSLREYHEKIAARIEGPDLARQSNRRSDRYYIHKTRPFFVNNQIYYEVTFYRAINKVSKFDRIIAFTKIDITDKYAASLTIQPDSIEVLNRAMPIIIIRDWVVSIRPCEIDNFARLLGITLRTRTNSPEYRYLMHYLTDTEGSLLDLLDIPEETYAIIRESATKDVDEAQIFPVLDRARRIVRLSYPGCNVIRYMMLRMHNLILKSQYHRDGCNKLSDIKLKYGCIPFETMPFCTSLPDHNPRYWDLIESLDPSQRNHEMLARRVKNNVEHNSILYTPEIELEPFGDLKELISTHNSKLYIRHPGRALFTDKKHVSISEYEDQTVAIIQKLQKYASSRIDGYTQSVTHWLNESNRGIDDLAKADALKQLFSQSHVALIYGAAGTGKSTIVDHIAKYFNDKQKLFLAHTHPALDNLRRKVTAQNSVFQTVNSQIHRDSQEKYDLLVIDECSTVSNADLIEVLEKTRFKLLVLVGDIYQIEAIQFGNWFTIARDFIPRTSIFELNTPYRNKNISLLEFWNAVRNVSDNIAELIARNKYSTMLDSALFEPKGVDEIILCLNYDGLYGINNINRFLQSGNAGKSITWRESTYKVGDPILFYETERFRPVIYNNLKGRIVDINQMPDRIQFDVRLDRPLNELDVASTELIWVGDSTVRFSVYDHFDSDNDDDSLNTTIPFQVAYAVSIHKVQGLEYDSVKIVITDANDEDITHSIFYTAVTRAREYLRIFWTPETQQKILKNLNRTTNSKDVALLSTRRSIYPRK